MDCVCPAQLCFVVDTGSAYLSIRLFQLAASFMLPTRLAPGCLDEDLTETIQVLGAVCEKIFRERHDHIILCKSKT
jgi:hypothetical protein